MLAYQVNAWSGLKSEAWERHKRVGLAEAMIVFSYYATHGAYSHVELIRRHDNKVIAAFGESISNRKEADNG